MLTLLAFALQSDTTESAFLRQYKVDKLVILLHCSISFSYTGVLVAMMAIFSNLKLAMHHANMIIIEMMTMIP